MNPRDLDEKTIYVDMWVCPANQDKLLRIQELGRLVVKESCVTVDWYNADTKEGKSITLSDGQVKQTRPNTSQEKFRVAGKESVPDFIYIESGLTRVNRDIP